MYFAEATPLLRERRDATEGETEKKVNAVLDTAHNGLLDVLKINNGID